jgi:hypothetical protein
LRKPAISEVSVNSFQNRPENDEKIDPYEKSARCIEVEENVISHNTIHNF